MFVTIAAFSQKKALDTQGLLAMICSGLEPLTPTLSR